MSKLVKPLFKWSEPIKELKEQETQEMIMKCLHTNKFQNSYYLDSYMKNKVEQRIKKRLSLMDILRVETDLKIYTCLLQMWLDNYEHKTLVPNNQFTTTLSKVVKNKYVMSKTRVSNSLKRLKNDKYLNYHIEEQPHDSPITYINLSTDRLSDIVRFINKHE